jgi:hypothetical protein
VEIRVSEVPRGIHPVGSEGEKEGREKHKYRHELFDLMADLSCQFPFVHLFQTLSFSNTHSWRSGASLLKKRRKSQPRPDTCFMSKTWYRYILL